MNRYFEEKMNMISDLIAHLLDIQEELSAIFGAPEKHTSPKPEPRYVKEDAIDELHDILHNYQLEHQVTHIRISKVLGIIHSLKKRDSDD